MGDHGLFRLARTSLGTITRLIRARVDLYIDPEIHSAYASIAALLSLARNRAGIDRESAQHKQGNDTHLMYFNPRNPIRHIDLQLGRMIGCEPIEPDHFGPIWADAEGRREFAAKLAAAGLDGQPYIVVNTNASDQLIERRRPAERFVEVVEALLAKDREAVIRAGPPRRRTGSSRRPISGARHSRRSSRISPEPRDGRCNSSPCQRGCRCSARGRARRSWVPGCRCGPTRS